MKNITILLAVVAVLALAMPAQAGLFKIDFSDDMGENAGYTGLATGWDTLLDADYDQQTAGVTQALTDQNGSDDNVTITMMPNATPLYHGNSKPAARYIGDGLIDGITIPNGDVWTDYFWRDFEMKIEGLDAGTYNVSAFLGRTSDSSQGGEIIVTANTVTEMPTTGCTLITDYGNNTGGYPANSPGVAMVENIVVGENETLWFRHLEDGTGGTAGMIVNLVPEPATMILLGIGGIGVLLRKRRAA